MGPDGLPALRLKSAERLNSAAWRPVPQIRSRGQTEARLPVPDYRSVAVEYDERLPPSFAGAHAIGDQP